MNIYYLVGMVNGPYKQQAFEAGSREEAIEKYCTLYQLSPDEKQVVQVFQVFFGETQLEIWLKEDRGNTTNQD